MEREEISIVGIQNGDEGKGKVVEYLAKKAVLRVRKKFDNRKPVVVLRFQGGANAGHSITVRGEKYALHQIPVGILVPGTYNLEGEGVFYESRGGMKEILELRNRGVEITPDNFGIASNAHVTLANHIYEDRADFMKPNHTSTGKGIKQTARDKMLGRGVRFQEFLDRETFIEILREKSFPGGLVAVEDGKTMSLEEFADSYEEEREFLSQFSVLQAKALKTHGTSLKIAEGAQGFRLDVDTGLYPGITASNPSRTPFRNGLVLGVVKLYESSVGHDRPFVGRILPPILEARLRTAFGEFGTTTGKPRDLGWFDAVAVRHAIECTGTDYLVGTCGDRLEVLAQLGEPVRIVTGYKINGRTYEQWDKSFHNRRTLYGAEPVLEELPAWEKFADDNGELTGNAQRYIDRIQRLTGKEFVLLGTGPAENQVVELDDVLSL